MRQLIGLVKKDFLLIKKYNIVMLLFSIIAPIFISLRTPEFQSNGFVLYGLLALMLTFMNYHMISMEEMKQKGMVYIQTTPISNSFIGLSKFIVVLITFMTVSILYFILSKIDITKVGAIGLKEIMLTFILIKIFFSIYIPLTFKLGYVKLQMVSAGIIFLSPFLIGLISKRWNNIVPIFLKFESISNLMFFIISLIIIIIMMSISTKITSLILHNKEY
jgi:ABC-2 type transport system permease protein